MTAISGLDTLRSEFPELFDDASFDPDWDEDWILWEPDRASSDEQLVESLGAVLDDLDEEFPPWDTNRPPLFPNEPPFPGAPTRVQPTKVNPPDALAFYLPFHLFHPTWWGIYLLLEGWLRLAFRLRQFSSSWVPAYEALLVAREFLYRHEYFHHKAEFLATRLEIFQREPVYVGPFRSLYKRTLGRSDCLEESLANAYAYRETGRLDDALEVFIRRSPPGYCDAHGYLTTGRYKAGRNEFAEQIVQEAFPKLPSANADIWGSFPEAYTGGMNRRSREIYLLPKNSPLVRRLPLDVVAPISYRKLRKGLKKQGRCVFVRQGKGSHEIWEAPNGNRFSLPRHPGDLAKGTVRDILKQAGLDLSLREFQANV